MFIQKEIIKKVRRIPPLSHSASQLMRLMGDPDHGIGDVARIVQCDSALTTQILRVVNSAALSLMGPITSVSKAISYLGGKFVFGIALDFCASTTFSSPLKGYETEGGALWEHSLRTAIASKEMALWAREEINPDLAFTCGILHDIGKAVISEFLEDSAKEILAEIDNGTLTDYLSAEDARIGINHCVAGGALAAFWNLPVPFPEIIRHHHHPGEAKKICRPLAYAVHLGDIIAMMGGSGTGADTMQYHLDTKYTDYIDVSPDTLAEVMLQVEQEFQKTRSSLFDSI
jgi:putative nucleotidyltransferase with HDIG domain